MEADAVILEMPHRLSLRGVELAEPAEGDAVVDVLWSGISTGTEKLLWDGRMPEFPGMGYPLVPGYEAVGRVRAVVGETRLSPGELVFVPGARCHLNVRSLFGASASRLVVNAGKIYPVSDRLGRDATLLALAATAYHAVAMSEHRLPDLIIGHGVLGRLIARVTVALGGDAPTVWETNPARFDGASGYNVINGRDDARRDYRQILDASGDPAIIDTAVAHMARGGELVLAGCYSKPLAFDFAPAFMREAAIRISAEFDPSDVEAVLSLVEDDVLSLAGLISHAAPRSEAAQAYEIAFRDPSCTKMIIDWEQGT